MKFLLVLLALTLLPAFSFASCEDGHATAEQAVASATLRKLDPRLRKLLNCKQNAQEEFEVLPNNDEVYTVVQVCGPRDERRTDIFQVVLHEVEDAVCIVKSVTKIGAQG